MTEQNVRTVTLSRPFPTAIGAASLLLGAVILGVGSTTLSARLVFSPVALVMGLAGVRLLMLAVVIRPDGLTIRNLLRTHHLDWAQVAAVVDRSDAWLGRKPGVRTTAGRIIRFTTYVTGSQRPYDPADQWIAAIEQARRAAVAAVPDPTR
jgi:hypothetical protein